MTISDGLDDSGASRSLRPTKKAGEDSAITPKTRVKTDFATVGLWTVGVALSVLIYARIEARFDRITDSSDRTDRVLSELSAQTQGIHDALLANGMLQPAAPLRNTPQGYAPTVRPKGNP